MPMRHPFFLFKKIESRNFEILIILFLKNYGNNKTF